MSTGFLFYIMGMLEMLWFVQWCVRETLTWTTFRCERQKSLPFKVHCGFHPVVKCILLHARRTKSMHAPALFLHI